MNAAELRGIEAVAHGYGKANVQPFAGLHYENLSSRFGSGLCGFVGRGGVDALAGVIENDVVDQRSDEVHARVQGTGTDARKLADADGGGAGGHYGDREGHEEWQQGDERQLIPEPPANRLQRATRTCRG